MICFFAACRYFPCKCYGFRRCRLKQVTSFYLVENGFDRNLCNIIQLKLNLIRPAFSELSERYFLEEISDESPSYWDSDYANYTRTRKITAGGAVSLCSIKQPIVATLSSDSEYITTAECCRELVFIKTMN